MGHVEDAGEVDGDDVFPVLDHGLAAPGMPLRRAMPALLTRIETWPTLSANCLAIAMQSSRLVDVERKALGLAAGIADFLRRLGRRLLVHVEHDDARTSLA